MNESKHSKNEKSPHELILHLIDLLQNMLDVVKKSFKSKQIYHKALREAFETFINKEYYTSALLARYANDILKKGSKLTGSELDSTMDYVVMLYGYIRCVSFFCLLIFVDYHIDRY